jgi:hypothetical protein
MFFEVVRFERLLVRHLFVDLAFLLFLFPRFIIATTWQLDELIQRSNLLAFDTMKEKSFLINCHRQSAVFFEKQVS